VKRQLIQGIALILAVTCSSLAAAADIESQTKTVIGPTNQNLYDGAQALLAGDGKEGVRLSLLGLRFATGRREVIAAKSNLCAGYLLLGQYQEALSHCDEVIAENDTYWRAYSNRALVHIKLGQLQEAEQDLQRAESFAKNSRNVKTVRSMLLDLTDPVVPEIIIDDRRKPADDTDE